MIAGDAGDLPELQSIDPDEIRRSDAAMEKATRQIAHAGDSIWTGSWQEFTWALRGVGAVDLCLARLVEGHADAIRILSQAGVPGQPGVYGVWASRSAGTGLTASRSGSRWRLDGELRFASGIGHIDRALIPGWLDADNHVLVDVPVRQLDADEGGWVSAGMDASRSLSATVAGLTGTQVGDVNFYLRRPGFVAGGIGPAAVWLGGAAQIAALVAYGLSRFEPSPHQLRRLGLVEQLIGLASASVERTARWLDQPDWTGADAGPIVAHARTGTVQAADATLAEAPLIVGPAGLSTDARLARALADLAMYVRQHHLDRELETAGRRALERRTLRPR